MAHALPNCSARGQADHGVRRRLAEDFRGRRSSACRLSRFSDGRKRNCQHKPAPLIRKVSMFAARPLELILSHLASLFLRDAGSDDRLNSSPKQPFVAAVI
jgi:hypothetical protein